MIISIESELRRIESIQSNRNAPKNERKSGVNMIRAVSNSNCFFFELSILGGLFS